MKLIQTQLSQVDTTPRYDMLQRAEGQDGKEYIYLTGVGSTVVGSWVTYDELGITTLLVANAIGPVAVAMAITNATTEYGWYQIFGSAEAKMAANCAANVVIGYEGASGVCGDGHATGDNMRGAVSRDETVAAAVATVQLYYPFVDDDSN